MRGKYWVALGLIIAALAIWTFNAIVLCSAINYYSGR